jgi:hypothetical protein
MTRRSNSAASLNWKKNSQLTISSNTISKEVLYRSTFSLKGKGTAIDAYEISPNNINGDHIIRFLNEYAGKRIRWKIPI